MTDPEVDFQINAAPTRRTIAGRLNETGEKESGEGFTCSSTKADGKYHIDFDRPYNNLHVVSVAQIDHGNNHPRYNALPYEIENGGMYVLTGDERGYAASRPFTLIGVGS